jgi:hypothetical protein
MGASGLGALGTWLVSLAGPAIRKILLSIGIGVASYAAISTALNSALGAAKSAYSGITGDVLQLLSMAGTSVFLSIIAGALVARVSLMVVKKLEILK